MKEIFYFEFKFKELFLKKMKRKWKMMREHYVFFQKNLDFDYQIFLKKKIENKSYDFISKFIQVFIIFKFFIAFLISLNDKINKSVI